MEIFRIQYFNCINSMKHRVIKTSFGRGRSKFLNYCWIPVVILFNKNICSNRNIVKLNNLGEAFKQETTSAVNVALWTALTLCLYLLKNLI